MRDDLGYFPKWPIGTGESGVMIGSSTDTVIADAYLRGVRDYNDSLVDGRIAGKGADEVIATLVQYTDIKDAALHRETVPAACNPDGFVDLKSLEGDLAFFKEMKLIEKPEIGAADVVDHTFVEKVVGETGKYQAHR